ncbi:unnamed protein product [Rangifer tarandus platyrhynchus]|uniref:Uncharacterized protein n=2 Tax=Rangifer tarandus platyrhynchus TaxID=3082113 RepID=A0ACB0F500_RANTA|nr:unnamed protein product [Rangifer tarandus platyrhynchus]CAI9708085.1 unnamed protein product [Rangifer tarandus platyrhynchus]
MTRLAGFGEVREGSRLHPDFLQKQDTHHRAKHTYLAQELEKLEEELDTEESQAQPLPPAGGETASSPQQAGNKQSKRGAVGPPWLPGDATCIHLGLDGAPTVMRHLGCAGTLIQNLAQEALGIIKAAASSSQHVTHTPLRAENNSVRALGGIVPSEKTSESLRGQRGTASAAPAEPCPALYHSVSADSRPDGRAPVTAGSSLPRDKTAYSLLELLSRAPHCCPATSARSSILSPASQASWDPSPDRPGFSDFIPPSGHESRQLESLDPK